MRPVVVVVEADVAELDPVVSGGSGTAPGASSISVCVSSISKMRSAAAIACWRFALTRLSFFTGPYIRNSAAMNDVNCARGQLLRAIAVAPYHSAAAMPSAAEQLHDRRQARHDGRHLHVRPEQAARRLGEPRRLPPLGAERLHDAMAGERLGAHVRQVLELLLAPARALRRSRCPSRTSG